MPDPQPASVPVVTPVVVPVVVPVVKPVVLPTATPGSGTTVPPTTPPTGQVVVTAPNEVMLPCEDFGERLGFRRSAMALVDVRGRSVPGCFISDEGVTWLAMQALDGAVAPSQACTIRVPPADPKRPAPPAIDWTIKQAIPVGDGPAAWLIDASELLPALTERTVHPMPLVDATGAWRRRIEGDAVLSMRWEFSGESAWIRHSVARLERFQSTRAGMLRLVFAPPLPASASGSPMLDRGGFLVGLVARPVDGDASTARIVGPEELRAAMQSPPLDWPNRDGLQQLVAQMKAMGFTRLAARRVRPFEASEWSGLYDAPAAPATRAFLGFVSSDASHGLRLEARRGDSCNPISAPPATEGGSTNPAFAPAPAGVWLDIERPVAADGASVHVWSRGGAPSGRLLEIHALPENAATANLPPVETLIGLGRRTGISAWPAGRERPTTVTGAPESTGPSTITTPDLPAGDDDQADPLSALGPDPEPRYGPSNPSGPIIRLPLRGSVGFCGDSNFFTAGDFRVALRTAAQARPSAIVLEIKSPGGRVDSEREIIAELLLAQRSGERIVAEVRDAGSAAALIAIACKEILTYPAARVGAASTWRPDEDGKPVSLKKWFEQHPDPELEAKFESFEAATHREAALVSGHSEFLAPAMRHKDAELWWREPEGPFQATGTGAPGETKVDGKDTELTLTNMEMLKYQLSKECVDAATVPTLLGLPNQTIVTQDEAITRTPRLAEQLVRNAGGDADAVKDQLKRLLEQP